MVTWFQRGRFTGFWLSIGGGCVPTGCSGICSVVGGARRYRLLVVATVLVLQALEGLSDREAIGRLRCDIRWKAAAGLSLTDEGFHPTVLTLWRARLRRSSAPERVFNAVRAVVAESGVLSGRNRRVLDDAVVTQDTVTMITAQIRGCRRLIAQARQIVVSHDYEQPGRPSCDWGDPQSRSGLINGLVGDGLAVLESVEGVVLDPEQTDAVGLLAVVVGQDTERACQIVCVRV